MCITRKRLQRTTLKRFYSLEEPNPPLPSALPFTDHHSRQFYQVCYPTTIAAFLFSQAAQTVLNIEKSNQLLRAIYTAPFLRTPPPVQ